MKRIFLSILIVTLCLTGCVKNSPAPPTQGYTAPTLPEFDKNQGPEAHLQAIFDGLRGKAFTAAWGSGWENEPELTPCDTDTLRQLLPNENLVADFCRESMMVEPSNDGTFSYRRMELTVEEACALLCGRTLTQEEQTALSAYSETMADLTISTDGDQLFKSLRLTVTLDNTQWHLQITITRK